MRRGGGVRYGRIALLAAGALFVLLVLGQLILPRIAASRIRSRVGRYGKVDSVSVSAWPAVEMLWGSVGSVHVSAGALKISPAQAAALLWEARGVHSMDMSAQSVRLGSLVATHAVLRKRGAQLSAEASMSEAQVHAALPAGLSVRLLRSEAGRVEVQATGGLFGVDASVNALAEAKDGRLVAHPQGFLIAGLQLTLFAQPHVYVEGVGASVLSGEPPGYRLTMSARLG